MICDDCHSKLDFGWLDQQNADLIYFYENFTLAAVSSTTRDRSYKMLSMANLRTGTQIYYFKHFDHIDACRYMIMCIFHFCYYRNN